MEVLLIPLYAIFLLSSVTPVPGLLCFHAAWNRKDTLLWRSIALCIPTTVFPVALLLLHGSESTPTWKEFGTNWFVYLGVGPSAWICLPPFAGANYVIARTICDREFLAGKLFLHLSMVTCVLICAFFALWNLHRGAYAVFPGSAACAYAYGLYTLPSSRALARPVTSSLLLMAAWLMTALLTVLAVIIRTKEMVVELPDERPPECFVVTAAAQGHQGLVGRVDIDGCDLKTRQLTTFRAFECWLRQVAPGLHRRARSSYNCVGPVVAAWIVTRWHADMMYLALKPLEWLFRFTPSVRRYMVDSRPTGRSL